MNVSSSRCHWLRVQSFSPSRVQNTVNHTHLEHGSAKCVDTAYCCIDHLSSVEWHGRQDGDAVKGDIRCWYDCEWEGRCGDNVDQCERWADKVDQCRYSKSPNTRMSAKMVAELTTRKSAKMVAELRNGTAPRIPDTADSRLEDYSAVDKALHANKAFMVVEADPPREFGINAVMSWMQWFGVLMWAGSPAVVYLATSLKQVRCVPGRPSGESLNRLGNPTLQTREQHIRGTQHHRTARLKTIAKRVELAKLGIALPNGETSFDTVTFDVSTLSSADLVKALEAKQINESFDETHYTEDVHAIIAALKEAGVKDTAPLPEAFTRTKPFLQQHIFNSIHSVTEMMLYMTRSQHKDLFLTISMISLGSCTMKLNSVASLTTCSWLEVMNIHPFALASNTIGNREMLNFLEAYLVQPTNGASGEYAGLLVIRKCQESIGKGHGNVCIIPKSANGTNPASAVMCGMKINWIDDSQGVPNEDVKIELFAVKSCKGPRSPGWNGWQIIVMETEYGDSWVDQTDENSQRLETYDAMRKTTESEREAKDQIAGRNIKSARNGGRRFRHKGQALTWLPKIGSEEGTEGCMKHAPNVREESETARD